MGTQISPFGNNQFFTPGGVAAVGYQLFVYAGRSTDKARVWTDQDGVVPHTNPIVLDANGFPPAPIYIDTTKAYKFVMAFPEDLDPPTLPLYTVDQVSVGLETPTVSTPEWSTGPTPTYVGATQFSVLGNAIIFFPVGRRVKALINSGNLYGTITDVVYSTVTTVTVQWDSGNLDNTLSAIWFSFLNSQGSSWPSGYSDGLTTNFAGPVSIPVTSAFNLMQAGSIFAFAGTATPPAGYLQCNGAAISRTQFAALFSVIGTAYGTGDGVLTFNVPSIANLISGVGYIIRYA
ncbi:MAG TPA: phage tail protein [Nitrospira sp.]|nr:phage tail protein [Nitrospira sp.]